MLIKQFQLQPLYSATGKLLGLDIPFWASLSRKRGGRALLMRHSLSPIAVVAYYP